MVDKVKLAGKTVNGLVHFLPTLTGKLLLDLFCKPNTGKTFTNKEKAFLAKADWVTLLLNNKKIQCYTWGQGERKILLAHGFNSNASRWRLLVNLLKAENYQIIALDIPAHGNSEWKRVNGILYAKVVEVVINHFKPQFIVGHSFAGFAFAYYFSKMNPLPIEKMVLMGVPNDLSEIVDIFFQTMGANKKVQSAYYTAFQKKFGYEANYFTLSKLLKEVSHPSLIIHDKNDEVASFAGAKILHQNMDNSSFFPTENLGHSLQGRVVYKKILAFLEKN